MATTATTVAAAPILASANGVIRVGSLDELDVLETEIEIYRPDGRVLAVPVRSLTQPQILEEHRKVRWPEPPATFVSGGKGQKPALVKNYEDADYQRQVQDANTEYTYRVLLRCLQIEIPGATEEARLESLKTRLGAWALAPIGQALTLMHGVSAEDIAAALKTSAAGGGSR